MVLAGEVRLMNVAMLEGVVPVLPTPLSENLQLDEAGLRHLVRFCIKKGFSGVVVLGSAGEFPYLSFDEKERVMAVAAEEGSGRIPVEDIQRDIAALQITVLEKRPHLGERTPSLRFCVPLLLLGLLCGNPGYSDERSPAGLWLTIDDDGVTPTSIIHILVQRDGLRGRIVEIVDSDEAQARCDKCTGELKGVPILGLEILSGLVREGVGWSGGKILDPENGKQYRCLVQLSEDGRTLAVRGYLGFTILGRTQHWHRVDATTTRAP
jgi:uncharacterized protein (DUF2147 family)